MFEPTMGYAAFIYKAPYNVNYPKEYDILGEVDGEMLFLLYSEHQIQILISLQKPKVIETRHRTYCECPYFLLVFFLPFRLFIWAARSALCSRFLHANHRLRRS